MQPLRVLLVEDSAADADMVRELLDTAGDVLVRHEPTLREALGVLSVEQFDVGLVDLSLPDAEALQVIHSLRSAVPHLPLVVLTGLDDEPVALDALAAGAQDYVAKAEATAQGVLRALRFARARATAAAPPAVAPQRAKGEPRPAGSGRQPWTVSSELVQRVQALRRQGASLHTIAAALNSDGVPHPDGRRWHAQAVARCLSARPLST